MKRLVSKIIGSAEEYERIEPNFFGRNLGYRITQQIEYNKRNYKLIVGGLIILIVLIIAKSILIDDGLLYEEGHLIGIEREDTNEIKSYNLRARLGSDSKDVTITLKPKASSTKYNTARDDDYYINEVVRQMEQNQSAKILLPDHLDNGKSISWERQMDYTALYLAFLLISVIAILRQNRYSKLKTFKKNAQEDIMGKLPSFINKLLITWQSGATLDQALEKTIRGSSSSGFFYEQLRQICDDSIGACDDLLVKINQFASMAQVREFKKMTNVMIENRNKGSFLLEKLEYEREDIWERRKARAIDEGKKAETKLVIPMSILLVTLIVVTAAPAFLEM